MITTPRELVDRLGPVAAMKLCAYVAEAIADNGSPIPAGVAFELEPDRVIVVERDQIEAALGVGGTLLMEVTL